MSEPRTRLECWDMITVDVKRKRKRNIENLTAFLDQGWEPFAVSDGLLYLRRPREIPSVHLSEKGRR